MNIIMTILGIIAGLLILTFLVVIHELGHALVARRNGVVVEEFGLGFPPQAWSKKLKNGVLFTLNWLPLGGFVRMKGEADSDKGKGSYGAASLWAKTKILLAGVLVNLLAAVVIFSVLYLVGIPKVLPNQFYIASDAHITGQGVSLGDVQANSPADKAGLKVNDEILKLDSTVPKQYSDVTAFTKNHAGQRITIEYERGNKTYTTTAQLRPARDQNEGILGVSGSVETIHAGWSAPIDALGFSWQLVVATFQGLGMLFADLGQGHFRAASQGVSGPVGIIGVLFPDALKSGIVPLLLISGLISLTLGVMNVLPIPALDGGRWFVTVLFRVLRRPLNKELEERIHGTGFAILLCLVALITVLDIGKLF